MKGEKYLPSNGSEGDCFTETYCVVCRRGIMFRNHSAKTDCEIFKKAFITGSFVKQWVYNENNEPVCTSFRHYQTKQIQSKHKQCNDPKLFEL